MKKHFALALAAASLLTLSSCNRVKNAILALLGEEPHTEAAQTVYVDVDPEAPEEEISDTYDTYETDYGFLSERKLSAGDLSGYSKQELRILRNAIYAKYGYRFKTADMKSYFGEKSWYTPRYDDVSSVLTKVEQHNVALIQSMENGGGSTTSQVTVSADDPFAWLSQTRLSAADLSGYDKSSLRILRNAIYARHGYRFKTADMKAYFGAQSWYTPRYDDVSSLLNATEKHNVALIQSME